METFPQVITVKDQGQGLNCAREILYEKSDNQTLLLLSGGSTPKDLYETLAKERKLKVKAIGMVDERKDKSNFETNFMASQVSSAYYYPPVLWWHSSRCLLGCPAEQPQAGAERKVKIHHFSLSHQHFLRCHPNCW